MSGSRRLALAVALLALGACDGHDHANEDHADEDHGHGHGGGIVITHFADETELFVEFPPLAVGRESAFAVHLTRLADYRAVAEGTLTVRLSGGGLPEEVFTADPSATAGIFRPVATPEQAGERQLVFELQTPGFTSIHDVGRVTVHPSAEAAEAAMPEEEEEGGLVPFLKETQWNVPFNVAAVAVRRLKPSVPATATVRGTADGEARLVAVSAGRISPGESGFPGIGDEVKAGDILAYIVPSASGEQDIAALKAALAQAEANDDIAEADLRRLEGLFEQGAVPERRVIEARAQEKAAASALEAARARLETAGNGSGRSFAGLAIRAPISGTVAAVSVGSGQYVEAGAALLHIVRTDRLWLQAAVTEADSLKLQLPDRAWFTIDGIETPYVITPENGRLVAASRAVDPVTRTVWVVFEFENPENRLPIGAMVERILLQEPEVASTARRTGRADLDEHAQTVNSAEIDVALKMGDRGKEELLADLRRKLAAVPGMNIVIGQPISHRIDHMLSGTRANIALNLFGPDLYQLRRVAEDVRAAIAGVEGLADLSVELQSDIPILTVDFRRDVIARHGLSIRDVSEAVEAAFVGHEVSQVLEGQTSFDLVVRYPEGVLADVDTVRETLFTTTSGAQVPLHALADIRRDGGPNMISRENVQRKITVMANVAGRDLLGVVEDIRANIGESVVLPSGYHIEYGGQFESAGSASRTLTLLGGLVVIGIFLLLFMAFGAARDALLVMVNLPLALIGGVVGVHISGGILSVASIIGFITLFGIATRNGVMMVSHIRNLLETGEETDFRDAVERGAMERLVPILMTALAAGLALVPLALSAGEPGSEIQAPMAIVILSGLLSSTALNMLVLPAVYLRFGERRQERGKMAPAMAAQ